MNGSTDRALASVAADLLAGGALVHPLSAGFTLLAATALVAEAFARPEPLAQAPLAFAVLAGLGEVWLAVRVRLDARLFERLARGESPDGLAIGPFDAALAALGWMPAERAGRPMADRVRGATRLLAAQGACAGLQVLLLLAHAALLAGSAR